MTPRVLVITEDPVGAEMGGNAIRAYELARVLAGAAEVALAAPRSTAGALSVEHVPFDRDRPRTLRPHLRAADVVVALPQNPVIARELARCGARIVYDLYDAKPLQVLEAFAGARAPTRRYWATIALDHVLEALRLGDYLICASERQRDLWIGAMLASRLITPTTYSEDPSLRGLIEVVPFGVPTEPPVASGDGPRERFASLERDAEIVLWNGGLWNWLDPVCAVEAIALVHEQRPRARLVFMGRAPSGEREATQANKAYSLARELGLLDRSVFFNDRWVPYGQRAAWLLAADCAVSLHVEHLETRFSFRTRLLDCLWAGVPIVCTSGDELAEKVEREGLGAKVKPGESAAAAAAISAVLERGRASYRDALARASQDYLWPAVAAPLIGFVTDRSRGRPRRRASAISAPGRLARATATRLVRTLLRAGRRLS